MKEWALLLSQENGDVVFKGLNVAIREGSAVRGSFQMRDAVYTKADEEDLTRTDAHARAHSHTHTHTHTHTRGHVHTHAHFKKYDTTSQ